MNIINLLLFLIIIPTTVVMYIDEDDDNFSFWDIIKANIFNCLVYGSIYYFRLDILRLFYYYTNVSALVFGIFGAVVWRLRGGEDYDIKFISYRKVLDQLLIGLTFTSLSLPMIGNSAWYIMPLMIAGISVGYAKWWHVESLKDILMMSLRGALNTLPIYLVYCLSLERMLPIWFLLAGATFGLSYLVGNYLFKFSFIRDLKYIKYRTDIAEYIVGFIIFFSFVYWLN